MVGLLALANDRGVEAELAPALHAMLDAGELPALALLIRQFTPVTTAAPVVSVILPSVVAYDRLLAATARGVAAGPPPSPATRHACR